MAYKFNKLRGVDIVMNNLQKQMEIYKLRGTAGMLRAVALLRRSMKRSSPKIPIDTGNLRASWFVVSRLGSQNDKPAFQGEDSAELQARHSETINGVKSIINSAKQDIVIFGFSANYAWHVHENVTVQYKRPGAGAKFLEASLNREADKMLQIMAREMKQ